MAIYTHNLSLDFSVATTEVDQTDPFVGHDLSLGVTLGLTGRTPINHQRLTLGLKAGLRLKVTGDTLASGRFKEREGR